MAKTLSKTQKKPVNMGKIMTQRKGKNPTSQLTNNTLVKRKVVLGIMNPQIKKKEKHNNHLQ